MDLAALRELAEKANTGEPWYSEDEINLGPDDAFIAAVSPEVVLALCDERDEVRLNIEWALGILTVNEHEDGSDQARAATYLRNALARLEELPVK